MSALPDLHPLYQAWALRNHNEEQARAIAEAFVGSYPAEAGVVLAYLEWREGYYARAAELALGSMNALRHQPPSLWFGNSINILGCLAGELSRLDEAMQRFTHQLEVALAIGNRELEAYALHDLGMAQSAINPQSARFYFNHAVKIAAEIQDNFGIALAHLNMGMLDQQEEKWASAAYHFERSIEQVGLFSSPSIEAAVRGSYLDLLLHRGDQEGAQEQVRQLRRLLKAYPERLAVQIEATYPLARECKHDPQAVIDLVLPLTRTLQDVGIHRTFGELQLCLSEAYAALGDYRVAYESATAALKFERQLFAKEQQRQMQTLDVLHRTSTFERIAEEERQRSEQLQAHVQELQRLNVRIHQLSRTDSLTGLANRHYLFERGEQLAQQASEEQPLAVALLDIQKFKQVNDTYGHLAGDVVLTQVAAILRDGADEDDLVTRYGGEEFVMLRPKATAGELARTCETLNAQVMAFDWSAILPGHNISIALNIGVSQTVGNLEEAIGQADRRMYIAKHRGSLLAQIEG